ncbi:hypothetical protein PhCBS80983_g03664 [Powellomyces hirtus]|uniref:Tubulin polyglutamylase TTLL2 n=1 Tax=Powellomyces hirtus TaxID=109895 RepID=A0A507E2S6_9FUNG|nr:hypothetical protein PhCBS80983_g03664 [Powellomyces hirtus]
MRGIYGAHYDFVPQTFSLPNDYVKFVNVYADEEHRGVRSMWICKPADQSRGRGIFVFRDLRQLTYDCNAVLQRYVANPLLISGYKFDMRCYVVVRSYNPLVIYLNHEGLARFATSPYTLENNDVYAHLTNTSINKFSPYFEHEKEEVGSGCRWTLGKLRGWFESMNMDFNRVWKRIQATIISTLLPIAADVPPVPPGCFELYGFDILLDEALKPWLLEVNFGPALSMDSDVDVAIKKPLLQDILELIDVTDDEIASAEATARIAPSGKRRTQSAPSRDDTPRRNISSAGSSRKSPKATHLMSRANVGRLERIFPFNAEMAQLSAHPLTVGKPVLKRIIQEVRKGFA